MEKILISACLLGQKVRYDGADNPQTGTAAEIISIWQQQQRLVVICPEVSGGLPVPRPASEIQADGRIITINGENVTQDYQQGAVKALEQVQKYGIKIAILKERSPSCGSTHIYDGTFQGKLIEGQGVTAALLRQHGVKVFSEESIEAAFQYDKLLSKSRSI